ncbi:MAG: tetratricopeptide repeat protein [Myxococcota bacterium]
MRARLMAISPAVMVCFAGLGLVTTALYAQLLAFDFVRYDDLFFVVENARVKQGLTPGGFYWALTSGSLANWHPLTWLSHMLDVEVWGMNASGHHATAVGLHVANTLLLFAILRGMTGSAWRSVAVAALFSLHPLHVESVAWVSARGNLLSSFFGLLAMAAWVARVRGFEMLRLAAGLRVSTRTLAVVAFGLSLMAKPMWVTLPFALLLLDYWPLGRLRGGPEPVRSDAPVVRHSVFELVREKAPLFALCAVSAIITYSVQARGGNMGTNGEMPLVLRLANGVVSYARYLGKTLWPSELSPLYPHPYIIGSGADPFSAWQIGGAALLLAALSAGAALLWKRLPYVTMGWLWFVGTLLPAIGFVQIGMQAMADRYTYIPLIGLFVAVVFGLGDLARRLGRHGPAIVGSALALVIAILGVVSHQQSQHWRDAHALSSRAVEVTPTNSVMLVGLAASLAERGNEAGAIDLYQRALDIHPNFGLAHANLGRIHKSRGEAGAALAAYRKAVEVDPLNALLHFELGRTLAQIGLLKEAVESFEATLARVHGRPGEPRHADIYLMLGNAFHQSGEVTRAAAHYRRALAAAPERAPEFRLWIERAEREQHLVGGTPRYARRAARATAAPTRFTMPATPISARPVRF